MALFTPTQLGAFLRRPSIDFAAAEQAQRVASGWLQSATGLTVWPDPLPDDLYGWALALGAAVYENPAGLEYLTVEQLTYGYGGGQVQEILKVAAGRSGGTGGPRYAFPAAGDWPENVYVGG